MKLMLLFLLIGIICWVAATSHTVDEFGHDDGATA